MTKQPLKNATNVLSSLLLLCLFNACTLIQKRTLERKETPLAPIEKKTEVLVLPTALKINDEVLTSEDFEQLVDRFIVTDTTNPEKLSKEIIFRQLAYKEAMAQGYGDNDGLAAELKTYREIIYDNYRVDSSLIRQLSQDAYQNLQSDVEVAHILVYCSPFEEPEVIAQKRELAKTLKERIERGTAFEAVAKEYSDDKNTAVKGGYMGWYTGLQLIYPLETAAYGLAKNQVSDPIQTEYGFHLVKLLDKRASRGRVKVKHLLRVVPPKVEGNLDERQKNTVDSLYNLADGGYNFDSLIVKFSDDFRTRNEGGVLPEFWIGSREEKVVEEAVFKLKSGQLSKPVRSSAGWHIFKLIERRPIPSFSDLKNELETKVTTDSRGEYLEEEWLKDTREGLNFMPNASVIESALNAGSASLENGKWKIPTTSTIINSYLFSVSGESISVRSFFTFVQEMQEKVQLKKGVTPKQNMRLLYKKFEEEILNQYAGRNLEAVNRSFKSAVNTYKESIVVTNFLNDKVFQKSVTDSLSLAKIYSRKPQKYKLNERAKAIELISKDQAAIDLIENYLLNGKPYNLKRGITSAIFTKNSDEISDAEKDRLKRLVLYLKKNTNYVVEVGGHADVNEDGTVSSDRVQKVTAFLTQNGLPLTRIKENDFAKTQPVDRFDWQQNQRVTYRFFSNSITDLERIISNQGFKIEIIEDIFDKTEIVEATGIEWKLGNYVRTLDDGNIQKIIIEEIYPARLKTFKEAKTALIKEYQVELEQQLYDSFLKKYKVDANQSVIHRIITDKKQ